MNIIMQSGKTCCKLSVNQYGRQRAKLDWILQANQDFTIQLTSSSSCLCCFLSIRLAISALLSVNSVSFSCNRSLEGFELHVYTCTSQALLMTVPLHSRVGVYLNRILVLLQKMYVFRVEPFFVKFSVYILRFLAAFWIPLSVDCSLKSKMEKSPQILK